MTTITLPVWLRSAQGKASYADIDYYITHIRMLVDSIFHPIHSVANTPDYID